jgi:hypothetical protein
MPSTFANMFAPSAPLGPSLTGLVDSLYSGDTPNKMAEREAMIAQRRAEAALKAAQMRKYEAEEQARSEARAQRAMAPLQIAESLFPGRGAAVQDYRAAGGVVAPQPETAEMPGIIGGYPMDRPVGYTPQAEDALSRVLAMIPFSNALPGKTNAEQAMKASGELQNQNLISDVLASIRSPEQVSSAVAAAGGKPLYDDTQGRVLNLRTGVNNETGPQAVANVGKTNAETTEKTAHAGLYRAQAGRASRDDAPLVQVPDQSSPTGFVWSTRGSAVGKGAPIAGAKSVVDSFLPKPTATNTTRAQASDQDAASTLDIIKTARSIAGDERNFGASGILRNTVQDLIQQGNALAITLGGAAADVQRDIAARGSDVGLENFDPTLPQLDMMTNILAFRMAKMNDPAGRVTDQDFRIAKNQIGGRGFFANQKEFLSRLDLFENMLKEQRGRDRAFLSGGRAPPPGAATADYNFTPPPAAPQGQPTQIAVNPVTKERLGLINGQWVPIQ